MKRQGKRLSAMAAAMVLAVSAVPGAAFGAEASGPVKSTLGGNGTATASNAVIREEWPASGRRLRAATDSDAEEKPATPSNADKVWFDVDMNGERVYSITASVGAPPYYQIFKYHTTEETKGYYTFFTEYLEEKTIDSVGFLCTEDQYEELCDILEEEQEGMNYREYEEQGLCLIANDDGGAALNFYINYNLEPDTDYYFVGTRYSRSYEGDYKLTFMRDITVFLDNQGGDCQYEALYSKGNLWCEDMDRSRVFKQMYGMNRENYRFGGYYTEPEGKGTCLIDENGQLLEAMAALENEDVIYAAWIPTEPEKPVEPEKPTKPEHSGSSSDDSEEIRTGWQTYGDVKQYYTEDGSLLKGRMAVLADGSTGEIPAWKYIKQKWYAFGADGWVKYGWLYDPAYEGWFYLSEDGSMLTGWQFINGAWYYLNPVSDGFRGRMAADTTVDGWYVNADGVWVQ